MALADSGKVKNSIKIFPAIAAGLFLLFCISFFIGLIFFIPAWIAAALIMRKEIDRALENKHSFRKIKPFRYLGFEVGEFQHVYRHDENIAIPLRDAISSGIGEALELEPLKPLALEDTDPDLKVKETRHFLTSQAGATDFGSDVHLIVQQSREANMASIRWWVVLGGYIDKTKQMNFVVFAPLLIWFWLPAYLMNKYDVVGSLLKVHDGDFNQFDAVFMIRAIHETVFDVLISELESRDIDTSSLKLQQANVLNINVSGGKATFGSVVQGAFNSVGAPLAGGKAKQAQIK